MSKADIDDKSIRLRKTRPSLAPARSRALPRDRVPGATGTNKRPPRSAAVVAALIPSAEPRAHASPLRSRSGIQGSRTAAQPAKGVRSAHAAKPDTSPIGAVVRNAHRAQSPITPALKGAGARGRATRRHNNSAPGCHAACCGSSATSIGIGSTSTSKRRPARASVGVKTPQQTYFSTLVNRRKIDTTQQAGGGERKNP